MTISSTASFLIIVGGTILVFGSFVLYAMIHDKKQKHPR